MMIYKLLLTATLFVAVNNSLFAQNEVSYTETIFSIKKSHTFDPRRITPSYKPSIMNLEPPSPGGDSYRSYLLGVKKEVRKLFPLTDARNNKSNTEYLSQPNYIDSFPLKYHNLIVSSQGDTLRDQVRYLQSSGAPLDNTLAISNKDYLMCGINSKIYMHDLNTGRDPRKSEIFAIDFDDFASDGGEETDSPFDPKIIYDPEANRFILTFLTGRTPKNSGLILAFSSTDNPTDPWHVYRLPGNPFDNGLWSDYPAIAITKEELFYTINLLVPGSDWKTSFSETVIWQINKELGYDGLDIAPKVYGDIALDGRNLRNLAVVPGAEGPIGPNMYFLSNRNFDPKNDTTFLVEVTNSLSSGQANINITPLIADQIYGVPPNGRQANSNPNDPDDGFDTNDARILGAFQKNNEIQFVGNSVNPATGLAAIYHGFISNLDSKPTIEANIIGDNSLDLGYPNIVFTGNRDCKDASVIAFDHTSPTVFAGVSAVRFSRNSSGKGIYSKRMTLKEGENYVDKIFGSYERWGDYFGLQRKYDEPGVVYSAGFYGTAFTDTAGTWFSKLRDCECYSASVNESPYSDHNICLGQIEAVVENGISPYEYFWKGNSSNESAIEVNLCDYSYTLTVLDKYGCNYIQSDTIKTDVEAKNKSVFPNPAVTGEVSIYFELSQKTTVSVFVYSSDGRLVDQILNEKTTESGYNILNFSVSPLSTGVYIVKLVEGDREILSEKLIVP